MVARFIIFAFFILYIHPNLLGQTDTTTIVLINGSFEGTPQPGNPPAAWIDCGFRAETPPDIQPQVPGREPFFRVTKPAYHGNTYLGMVVRENETYERVGQKLSRPLKKGRCYSFSIYLTRSLEYISASHMSSTELKSFTTPVILRIYGGEGYCNQKELLAESEPVANSDWKRFDFEFKPKSDLPYLELEAFYKTPVLFPYNGNLLLDNASNIKLIPCPEDKKKYLAYKKEKATLDASEQKSSPASSISSEKVKETNETVNVSPKKQQKILKDLDKSKVKVGQTIKIEKLQFPADSFKINASSYPVLDEVYDFLKINPKIYIEIGGHTNSQPSHEFCDRLSTNRAKAVRDYILSKGIDEERISYKGYGKRQPIAPNSTKEGRLLNQRVEIKIISI
jgi:outer membrane protein OmpA-like peptidoglycan-associated protein